MLNYDWYWEKGLHDAKIIAINHIDLQYDFTLRHPQRNYLEIILDAHNAMFDVSIKSICLYNYKYIKKFEDIENADNYWWVKDELSESNGKYNLTIYLSSAKKQQEIQVVFESAKIER